MAHRGLSLEKRNQIKKYITEGPLWSFPTLRELSRALCLITNHNDANQIYMHIYYLDRYYNILNENGLIRRKRGKTLGKFCQNFGAPYKPLFLRSKKMRSSKKGVRSDISKWIVKKVGIPRSTSKLDRIDEIVDRYRNIKLSFSNEYYITYPVRKSCNRRFRL